jgi:predicted nuclease with TOPRIM domain
MGEKVMDPANAGMDNPPEPVRDDYDVAALMRRVEELERENAAITATDFRLAKECKALQQRVKELEASLELRWADIAHLDTKLADVLDREWGLRGALTEVVRLLGIGAPGAAYRDALAALSAHKEGGTNVPENEEGQCAEWPRCACGRGGPDLCGGRDA